MAQAPCVLKLWLKSTTVEFGQVIGRMGAAMPPFFMATTITTINPPSTVTALDWNWQDQQSIDPLGPQAVVTLASGLATGTRADGSATTAQVYRVTGVNGIVGPGGWQANGGVPGAAVTASAVAVINNGTSGATNKTAAATTGGSGSGLTVNLTASSGVFASAAVNAAGTGYRAGDVVRVTSTVAGTADDVLLRVS